MRRKCQAIKWTVTGHGSRTNYVEVPGCPVRDRIAAVHHLLAGLAIRSFCNVRPNGNVIRQLKCHRRRLVRYVVQARGRGRRRLHLSFEMVDATSNGDPKVRNQEIQDAFLLLKATFAGENDLAADSIFDVAPCQDLENSDALLLPMFTLDDAAIDASALPVADDSLNQDGGHVRDHSQSPSIVSSLRSNQIRTYCRSGRSKTSRGNAHDSPSGSYLAPTPTDNGVSVVVTDLTSSPVRDSESDDVALIDEVPLDAPRGIVVGDGRSIGNISDRRSKALPTYSRQRVEKRRRKSSDSVQEQPGKRCRSTADQVPHPPQQSSSREGGDGGCVSHHPVGDHDDGESVERMEVSMPSPPMEPDSDDVFNASLDSSLIALRRPARKAIDALINREPITATPLCPSKIRDKELQSFLTERNSSRLSEARDANQSFGQFDALTSTPIGKSSRATTPDGEDAKGKLRYVLETVDQNGDIDYIPLEKNASGLLVPTTPIGALSRVSSRLSKPLLKSPASETKRKRPTKPKTSPAPSRGGGTKTKPESTPRPASPNDDRPTSGVSYVRPERAIKPPRKRSTKPQQRANNADATSSPNTTIHVAPTAPPKEDAQDSDQPDSVVRPPSRSCYVRLERLVKRPSKPQSKRATPKTNDGKENHADAASSNCVGLSVAGRSVSQTKQQMSVTQIGSSPVVVAPSAPSEAGPRDAGHPDSDDQPPPSSMSYVRPDRLFKLPRKPQSKRWPTQRATTSSKQGSNIDATSSNSTVRSGTSFSLRVGGSQTVLEIPATQTGLPPADATVVASFAQPEIEARVLDQPDSETESVDSLMSGMSYYLEKEPRTVVEREVCRDGVQFKYSYMLANLHPSIRKTAGFQKTEKAVEHVTYKKQYKFLREPEPKLTRTPHKDGHLEFLRRLDLLNILELPCKSGCVSANAASSNKRKYKTLEDLCPERLEMYKAACQMGRKFDANLRRAYWDAPTVKNVFRNHERMVRLYRFLNHGLPPEFVDASLMNQEERSSHSTAARENEVPATNAAVAQSEATNGGGYAAAVGANMRMTLPLSPRPHTVASFMPDWLEEGGSASGGQASTGGNVLTNDAGGGPQSVRHDLSGEGGDQTQEQLPDLLQQIEEFINASDLDPRPFTAHTFYPSTGSDFFDQPSADAAHSALPSDQGFLVATQDMDNNGAGPPLGGGNSSVSPTFGADEALQVHDLNASSGSLPNIDLITSDNIDDMLGHAGPSSGGDLAGSDEQPSFRSSSSKSPTHSPRKSTSRNGTQETNMAEYFKIAKTKSDDEVMMMIFEVMDSVEPLLALPSITPIDDHPGEADVLRPLTETLKESISSSEADFSSATSELSSDDDGSPKEQAATQSESASASQGADRKSHSIIDYHGEAPTTKNDATPLKGGNANKENLSMPKSNVTARRREEEEFQSMPITPILSPLTLMDDSRVYSATPPYGHSQTSKRATPVYASRFSFPEEKSTSAPAGHSPDGLQRSRSRSRLRRSRPASNDLLSDRIVPLLSGGDDDDDNKSLEQTTPAPGISSANQLLAGEEQAAGALAAATATLTAEIRSAHQLREGEEQAAAGARALSSTKKSSSMPERKRKFGE